MRGFVLSGALLFAAACGGNHNGQSVCDNVVPPPAACMTACDSQPGAPNTCPGGYHCTPDGHCDAQCTQAGGECGDGFHCTSDGSCEQDGACDGIACDVVKCESMGMPATTISGKVFAPNGTLPLYGVQVYVPLHAVAALADGAVCSQCQDTPSGDPIVSDVTKEDGTFTLTDVPSGANIPVVIVSGKWRRIITVSTVAQCTDNPVGAADTTLPKSMDDMTPNTVSVNMPKVAISTGSADSLECLFRKLGIADKEIGTAGGPQRFHLYSDVSSPGVGASKFATGFPGGSGNFADSMTTLWDGADHLKAYDAVILSCEGQQAPTTKSQNAMNAMKAYADFGGRVFASHWHNIWIEGSTTDTGGGQTQKPMVWPSIATWTNSNNGSPTQDLIDEVNNPKGMSFATWMLNVAGSTVRDQIAISGGKSTLSSVDLMKAEQWITTANQPKATQNFQFTTPNEVDAGSRCGKVVFSDMHVSQDSTSSPGTAFPGGCSAMPLTAQEKALAFMLFDLSSCVGQIF
jgi:hypothetical protein